MSKLLRLAAGTLVALGLACGAQAAETTFKAALSSGEEVPPNTSTAHGEATVTLNSETKEISWNITFDGLSGDAIAAHIHGPADKGANAGVVVNLGMSGQPVKSPLTGTATLTDAQIADLEAGKHYVNIHTAMYKGGEIRGQIMK